MSSKERHHSLALAGLMIRKAFSSESWLGIGKILKFVLETVSLCSAG